MNCPNCGAPLADGALFCGECGAKVEQAAAETPAAPSQGSFSAAPPEGNFNAAPAEPAPQPQTTYTAPSQPQTTYTAPSTGPVKNVEVNATPHIIWSIVMIVLCCNLLSIVGLVFAIKANGASTQEEADRSLKTAKTWNIVNTVLGVLYVLLMIILIATGIFADLSGGYYY